ncbi:MAG: glutathione S-transferase family protein [Shimia sp.]
MSLTLWGRDSSTNVQKAIWLLGELDLSYEHVPAGGSYGGLDTPAFAAMNPNRTVPVLRDGDHVVWESHAVMRYLADREGADTLYPADPAARSEVERWLDWHLAVFWPPIRMLFLDVMRDRKIGPDSDAARAALDRVAVTAALLADHLEARRWLGGGDFTLADIPIVVGLTRLRTTGLPAVLPPTVEEWLGRATERPAFAPIKEAERRLKEHLS